MRRNPPQRVIDSFHKKYRKDASGCWMWESSTNGKYPVIGINGQGWYAHRVSFFSKNGRMPNGVARHTCDKPLCVNPEHIIEGSHKDNYADMVSRGRAKHRENHPMAKLTWDHVNVIRYMHKVLGARVTDIGKIGWCSRENVAQICRGERWKNQQDSGRLVIAPEPDSIQA